MLDTTRANAKTAAFNEAFAAIGNSIATGMPRSKGNLEPVAWEYHVASHLQRIATARKSKAEKEAVKSGVLFDPEKNPMPVGTNGNIYRGEVVEIGVSVTTPQTRFDAAGFIADLIDAGVRPALIKRLTDKHTLENRAPHKFTSAFVTA
jgi:hypothetical protein